MDITREDRKEVAVEILKALNYLPEYIRAFKQNDKVGYSLGPGFVYYVSDNGYTTQPQMQEIIEAEEANTKHPHTVYAVIHGKYRVGDGQFSEIMESTDYLYVSNEDVKTFRKNKEKGHPALAGILEKHDEKKYGYIIRARAVAFEDEVGDIGVRGCNGGLIRTF